MQQPRHRSVFECLSVSSQVRPPSPPPGLVYGGDNYSDAGGQPLLHGRMLVGGVVVGDQVQRLVLGRLAVDLTQELQPLDMVCCCWHWPIT